MEKIVISSLEEITRAAKEFVEKTKPKKKFAIYGEMGVGKTTLIKKICENLGVKDTVNSPSFAIINEHYSLTNGTIFHFDFYRLDSPEEAYDFGYEDYFFSDDYCFVEWPEKIEALIPSSFIKVYITEKENGLREVVFIEE